MGRVLEDVPQLLVRLDRQSLLDAVDRRWGGAGLFGRKSQMRC
jgi:hypothetical protein